MKVLVLGVTGMLGSAVVHVFSQNDSFDLWGTLRNKEEAQYFSSIAHLKLISDVSILDDDKFCDVFDKVRPDVVINCIGLIKQFVSANDPLVVLPVNAMFPHRLAKWCALSGARLIHISTDCVFSGQKGFYLESDVSDAEDLYGKSKFIGEVTDLSHAITLRTSIIGHEIKSNRALLEWFLSQDKPVRGYLNAIFSGLPVIELARILQEYIIPKPDLYGLYHVASDPISKYSLLTLIKEVYGKKIDIQVDEQVVINRSLNAEQFRMKTDYVAPEWPKLVALMHESRKLYGVY